MKPGLSMGSDLTEAYAALGAITGITQTIETNEYQGNMLKYMHAEMVKEFDQQLHLKAGAMRQRFHHVYEWNMVGVPDAALWRHTLSGNGSTRTAGFEFMASKKPIPTPDERARDSNDPMSIVDPAERAKLSKRRYIFHWKAPIMEYRMHVTISPKYGQKLFIPTFRNERGFIFYGGSVQQQSGTSYTAGSFTSEWVDFFGGRGQEIVGEVVQKQAEADFLAASEQWAKTKSRRSVSLTIRSFNDNAAAFEAGRKSAQKFLDARAERRGEEQDG